MAREYKPIKQFEQEIIDLKERGYTNREIGEILGYTQKQVHDCMTRYNRNKKKLESGVTIKPKGRPRKDGTKLPPSIQQLSKCTQLQYELASKDRYIKRLEMENELMRDFLSLTERK